MIPRRRLHTDERNQVIDVPCGPRMGSRSRVGLVTTILFSPFNDLCVPFGVFTQGCIYRIFIYIQLLRAQVWKLHACV